MNRNLYITNWKKPITIFTSKCRVCLEPLSVFNTPFTRSVGDDYETEIIPIPCCRNKECIDSWERAHNKMEYLKVRYEFHKEIRE